MISTFTRKSIQYFLILTSFLFSYGVFAQAHIYTMPAAPIGATTQTYTQGKYVQLGVGVCGVYGAQSPFPASPLYPWRARPTNGLGFVADAGRNGWTVGGPTVTYTSGTVTRPVTYTFPDYCGDYFVPGSPVEGWGIQFSTPTTPAGTSYVNTDLGCFTRNIPGNIIDTNVIYKRGTCREGDTIMQTVWQGSVANVQVTQKSELPDSALFFITRITIKNNNTYPIYNVYYARNVDPDNEQPVTGGSFVTDNWVVRNPTDSTDPCLAEALVTATGINFGCFLGIGARDKRARTNRGSFSTTTPISQYWTGGGGRDTTSGNAGAVPRAGDEAIAIAFRFDTIRAGDSVDFAFAHVLRIADLECALSATTTTIKITSDSSDITSSGRDTVCPGDFVDLEVEVDTSYRVYWTNNRTLDTLFGHRITVRIDSTITYRMRGNKLGSTVTGCVVDRLITVYVDTNINTNAGPDDTICRGRCATLTASRATYYSWYDVTRTLISDTVPTVVVCPDTSQYYVVNSICGTDTVMVYVAPNFDLSASADTSICIGENAVVSVTPSPAGTYSYRWSPGGTITGSRFTATTTVQPTSPTRYTVRVTSELGCERDTFVNVATSRGTSSQILISLDTNNVCPGTPIRINTTFTPLACGASPESPASFSCDPASIYFGEVGTASTSLATAVSNPFPNFSRSRYQMILRASDLASFGTGTIQSLGFDMQAVSGTACENLTIRMACTNQNGFTAANFATTPMTTVLTRASFTPTIGSSFIPLDVMYQYDGISNLLIEICYDGSTSRGMDNPLYTATAPPNTVIYAADNFTAACTRPTGTPTNQRPNLNIEMCKKSVTDTVYHWTPSSTLWTNSSFTENCDSCEDPISVAYTTTCYNLRFYDGVCYTVRDICVVVDSAKLLGTSNDTTICLGDSTTLCAWQLAASPRVCIPNYTVSSIAHAPIAAGAGTAVTLGDDQMSGDLPIGFTFKYFCEDYTCFRISSNGFINIGCTSTNSACCSGQAVPSTFDPNNIIAFIWNDLWPPGGGTLQYRVVGTAPNRILVVEFINISHCCSAGADPATAQLLLYENEGRIEMHLTSVPNAGRQRTCGIENRTGTVGYAAPGRNGTPWAATNEAWRFTQTHSGGDTITTYRWSPAATLTNANIACPTAFPSTSTTYVVTATFSSGCTTVDSVKVNIGRFPYTIAAVPSDSVCRGASTQLVFTGGAMWDWDNTPTVSDTTSSSPTVTPPATPGTYRYDITAYDSIGCSIDTFVNVYVRNPVVYSLGPDTSICTEENKIIYGPSGMTSYTWRNATTAASIGTGSTVTVPAGSYYLDFNDGHCDYRTDTIVISNFVLPTLTLRDTAVCADKCALLAAPGGYASYTWSSGETTRTVVKCAAGSYRYSVVDDNGCQNVSNFAIVTLNALPVVTLPTSPMAICESASVTLDAGNPGSTYVWEPNGESTRTITVDEAGTYVVSVTNANGCIAKDTLVLTVNPLPNINKTLSTLTMCCGTLPISAGSATAASYQWSTGATTNDINVTSTGVYRVTATNSFGCKDSHTYNITIVCVTPTASAVPYDSTTKLKGETAGIVVTVSEPGTYSYSWTPASLVNNPNSASSRTGILDSTQTFTVTVTSPVVTTSGDTCRSSSSVTIIVIEGGFLEMPNAFTPNGDGRNDTYFPVLNVEATTIKEFKVFNRWGQIMHSSVNTPWDGKFQGEEQPIGTYVYYVLEEHIDIYQGGKKVERVHQGSFTLIK